MITMSSRLTRAVRLSMALAGVGALLVESPPTAAQNQAPTPRPFSVAARRYKFEPARIEVLQDDLVTIQLRTDDVAHSLTIDEYRIDKHVTPGRPVTFEFRAEKAGAFPFYCNLQTEDGCRQMRGELVVKPRK